MKKISLVTVFACSALMLMFSNPISALASNLEEPSTLVQTSQNDIDELYNLINQKRLESGLSSLAYTKELSDTANIRVQEVKTSFLHTRLDGRPFSTALAETGLPFKLCAELLAFNCITAEEVVNVWLNSPFHSDAILSPIYTNIGISKCFNDHGQTFWTVHLIEQ